MGQKRLFDKDPMMGTSTYWHVTDKGEYMLETVQDVTAIADRNKKEYNQAPNKYGDVNKVASIPLSVYYELKRQGIVDDPKALRKWLNDGDNRVFRTRAGTL
jgi:hypothetical protein